MSVTNLRNSTAIDKVLGITAVTDGLNAEVRAKGGKKAQADKLGDDTPATAHLTADNVCEYLQRTSAISCDELDALVGDLTRLREKLVADGGRLKDGILEFASLNQSVIKLTEVVADSVAHVQAPSLAE